MVRKWGMEMHIFHAIVPALYPFGENFIGKLKYLYLQHA